MQPNPRSDGVHVSSYAIRWGDRLPHGPGELILWVLNFYSAKKNLTRSRWIRVRYEINGKSNSVAFDRLHYQLCESSIKTLTRSQFKEFFPKTLRPNPSRLSWTLICPSTFQTSMRDDFVRAQPFITQLNPNYLPSHVVSSKNASWVPTDR